MFIYLVKFTITFIQVQSGGVEVFEGCPLTASSQRLGFYKGILTSSQLSVLESLMSVILPYLCRDTYFSK